MSVYSDATFSVNQHDEDGDVLDECVLVHIGATLPRAVLEDIYRRIGDWLASGGSEDDPYIEHQLRYAERFLANDTEHTKKG